MASGTNGKMGNVRDLVLIEDHRQQFFVVDTSTDDDEVAVEQVIRICSFEQGNIALFDNRRIVIVEVIQKNDASKLTLK